MPRRAWLTNSLRSANPIRHEVLMTSGLTHRSRLYYISLDDSRNIGEGHTSLRPIGSGEPIIRIIHCFGEENKGAMRSTILSCHWKTHDITMQIDRKPRSRWV